MADTRSESLKNLIEKAVDAYKKKVNNSSPPEIAVYAPGRVNLIGEHTDYNEGCVFPMAIDQVTVMVGSGRSSSDERTCRLITLSGDMGGQSDVTIPLPSPPKEAIYNDKSARMYTDGAWYRYVEGVVALMNRKEDGSEVGVPPFDVVIATNVPLGGGLSSSAALEVATSYFIETLCTRAGVELVTTGQQERGLLCQRAEHLYANSPCGIMDQFVCVMAQPNTACYIDCRPDVGGAYLTEPVPLRIQEKGLVVLIVNCKVKHQVNDGGYESRRDRCYEAAKIMNRRSLREATEDDIQDHYNELCVPVDKGPTRYQCALHVVKEIKRTISAKQKLSEGKYKKFGELMNESHASLRDQYLVSCPELDQLVELVRRDDRVYGSRMTGAGWGGCTVTLLEEAAVGGAIQRIKDEYYTPSKLTPEYYIVTPSCGGGVLNIGDYQ